MESKSWVIVRISDNQAMLEVFNESLALQVNKTKYKAVPIYEYLCNLNKTIKESNHA